MRKTTEQDLFIQACQLNESSHSKNKQRFPGINQSDLLISRRNQRLSKWRPIPVFILWFSVEWKQKSKRERELELTKLNIIKADEIHDVEHQSKNSIFQLLHDIRQMLQEILAYGRNNLIAAVYNLGKRGMSKVINT